MKAESSQGTAAAADGHLLSDDLFKMLKFVQKTEFSSIEKKYRQHQIVEAFTFLCRKVNVYDEATKMYNLSKSEILQKIFNCKESYP